MSKVAKVFMSGRSQAIRWPAKYRLEVGEVEIKKVGDIFILKPCVRVHEDHGEWLRSFWANGPHVPKDFMDDREDERPQERDWFSSDS